MATMFTRTINTYKATASELRKVDGQKVAVDLGSVVYAGASDNESAARKALKAAGVPCPRGTFIDIELVGSKTYGMTVDEFMKYAHEVER